MQALVVFFRFLGAIFKDAFVEWWEDSAARLAASVTFYTVFSLSPPPFSADATALLNFALRTCFRSHRHLGAGDGREQALRVSSLSWRGIELA